MLTELKLTELFANRFSQIYQETEQLNEITTHLKTKYQQLTQVFNQVSSVLQMLNQVTILVPQTAAEIWTELETIFQQDNCPISEVELLPADKQPTLSNPLIQVANQLLPVLRQGQQMTNPLVSRLMTESFGGTDAEGKWLWKDAYEALEAAQVMLIHQQGQELLNKFDYFKALEEIERISRLCPTQARRSETSIQLQQFSTPLPLGYIASIAAQITPDDWVLEPSAGTGILAAFAHISRAKLLLNEICPKRRGILNELFPNTFVSDFNAEQIDDYLKERTSSDYCGYESAVLRFP